MSQNSQNTYCLCKEVYDNTFMIQCDNCKDWFHGRCIDLPEYKSQGIDIYHCPNCVLTVGNSVLRVVTNNHRHDQWDPNAIGKPIQAGTVAFIEQLKLFKFSEGSEVIHFFENGNSLTYRFLQANSFLKPIIVKKMEGLGMEMPPKGFGVNEILNIVGGSYVIDVIDVHQQTNMKMSLTEFVKYYTSDDRSEIFNVISFEFSKTKLSSYVKIPTLADNLDWATNYWKKNPSKVQKYCLISTKDSYTDFHIDFGGTSVWYHVLSGQKVFYLITPTDENLSRYEQWLSSETSNEVFFGHLVKKCFCWTLNEGETMFIPSGWIHAVYTPTDSIVIGGNFLHNLSIKMQLKVYELEKRLETFERFKYPKFEKIHWYTAKKLYGHLKEDNKKNVQCADFLTDSLQALLDSLKSWVDKSNPTHRHSLAEVPSAVNYRKFFKKFKRELKRQNAIKRIHGH